MRMSNSSDLTKLLPGNTGEEIMADTEIRSAIDFYERHPISCEIILAKLGASRGHLDDLRPEELFPHDQDHYGGVAPHHAPAGRARGGDRARGARICARRGGAA